MSEDQIRKWQEVLADRLTQYRIEQGVSRHEMVEVTGVSSGAWGNLQRKDGKTSSPMNYVRVMLALGIPEADPRLSPSENVKVSEHEFRELVMTYAREPGRQVHPTMMDLVASIIAPVAAAQYVAEQQQQSPTIVGVPRGMAEVIDWFAALVAKRVVEAMPVQESTLSKPSLVDTIAQVRALVRSATELAQELQDYQLKQLAEEEDLTTLWQLVRFKQETPHKISRCFVT